MAKKPSDKKENNLKVKIRNFISKEGVLKTEIHEPKLEFGFSFLHPKGNAPNGKPKGRSFQINKPKKEDFLEIGVSTTISPEHVKKLVDPPEKKVKFYYNLRKLCHLKNITFVIQLNDNRYILIKRIYLTENNKISTNLLYKAMRKLFNLDIYIILAIHEICEGKMKPDDMSSSPSFYT